MADRMYENREMQRQHERSRSKKSEEKPEAPDMGEEDGEESSAHEIVAEHGPAHHTQIEKKGESEYHVRSHHEDGHKHLSKGHDVHSAHMHSMHMMTGEEPESMEEPESEQEPMGESEPAGIPGM